MIYEVIITAQARLDLKAIYEYIADVLMEPDIAEKQFTRIEKAVYSLDRMPERYKLYHKEPWRSCNLRVMPVDNFVVFYTVDNSKHIVAVARIMHGKRNAEKELDDMSRQLSEF